MMGSLDHPSKAAVERNRLRIDVFQPEGTAEPRNSSDERFTGLAQGWPAGSQPAKRRDECSSARLRRCKQHQTSDIRRRFNGGIPVGSMNAMTSSANEFFEMIGQRIRAGH